MNTVEKAKAIRNELKKEFPGTKFSVRTKKYSGGSSISVSWLDFPSVEAVEEITSRYESISRCEYTGEILSGGNTYIHTYNTWTEEMETSIKDSLVSKYGIEFYNEHIEGYNFYRYAREQFIKMYNDSLEPQVTETTEVAVVEGTQVSLNEEKNGIEIKFSGKPSEEIRVALKANGFRWSRHQGIWYAKQTDTRIQFANSLVSTIDNQTIDPNFLSDEEIESIIKHEAEYTNQILKEDLEKEVQPLQFEKVETNVYIKGVDIARKTNNINDMEYAEKENIIINKYCILSNKDFNFFSTNLLNDFTFLDGLGGTRVTHAGTKQEIDYNNYHMNDLYNNKDQFNFYEDNILITNEDQTKFIVVNPHGHSYCRYTGVLTAEEGTRILKKLKEEIKINPFSIVENNQEHPQDQSNVEKVNNIYAEVEALEKRLEMVTSAKLKYKIESEIQCKIQSIAKIIINDPILYEQFKQETKDN